MKFYNFADHVGRAVNAAAVNGFTIERTVVTCPVTNVVANSQWKHAIATSFAATTTPSAAAAAIK